MQALFDIVAAHAAERPQALAVRQPVGDRSLTWQGLEAASDRFAAQLAARGLGVADPVCHVAGAGIARVAAFLGALKAGCAFGSRSFIRQSTIA